MKVLRGRGRIAAAVGLAAAAAASVVMAVAAGPAQAADRGHCTENVNVRQKADAASPVVGVCRAGSNVTIDRRQGGYAHLKELGGWSLDQYVAKGPAAKPDTKAEPKVAAKVSQGRTAPGSQRLSSGESPIDKAKDIVGKLLN